MANSKFKLATKYLGYRLAAANGRGHGIHSPFVFEFVSQVLNDQTEYPAYRQIEDLRRRLLKDRTMVAVEDLGAGSAVGNANYRSVASIARHAAKPAKFGQLFFRIARHYRPGTILELGTSLGLSTAYLAAAAPASRVLTIEGAPAIAALARQHFASLGLSNIVLTEGGFDDLLPELLARPGTIDLAFVDGNHRREPVLRYFDALVRQGSPPSILIFDDIHWSADMEQAWEDIQADPRVMLTVDLFFAGLVFLRGESKAKQHFMIRF